MEHLSRDEIRGVATCYVAACWAEERKLIFAGLAGAVAAGDRCDRIAAGCKPDAARRRAFAARPKRLAAGR